MEESKHSLYGVLKDHVNINAMTKRNSLKSWKYGYDEDYDVIVISRDGTLGEVYEIDGLIIGLPKLQEKLEDGPNKWVAAEYPKDLSKIKTVFDWNRHDNIFKSKHIDYIEQEYSRRENGHWFMNNGVSTYGDLCTRATHGL